MANELIINYPSSSTLYALLFDSTGNMWNGSAFEAPGSASWTDYDIAMSEVATATGIYRASMPAVVAGSYGWVVRKQAGGTPAVSDVVVGSGKIEWDGTAEVTLISRATQTSVNDVPTNAEFEARTLAAANYFDPAIDVVAHVTLVDTVTTLSNMPVIPSAVDIKTALEIDGGKLDHLWEMTEDDNGVRRLTENALELGPQVIGQQVYVLQDNGGLFAITLGRTFNVIINGLAIPADWVTAYWTLKQNVNDNDAEALVQIVVSNPGDLDMDGLHCLNGVVWHEAVVDDVETEEDETDPEPFDRELASLTVDQPNGAVAIYLQDNLTTQLSSRKRIGWDVKFIDADGDSLGTSGLANLVRTETQTV